MPACREKASAKADNPFKIVPLKRTFDRYIEEKEPLKWAKNAQNWCS